MSRFFHQIAQTSRNTVFVLSVDRSSIVAEKWARQSSSLTPTELAAYCNELIGKKVFDYDLMSARLSTTMTEPVRSQVFVG